MKIKNMNTFCSLIGENCFWCKQECKEPYLETTCDFCEDQCRHWDKFCEVCWKFIKIETAKNHHKEMHNEMKSIGFKNKKWNI